MYELMSLPISAAVLGEYGNGEGLRAELDALGIQGIEGVWAMEPIPTDLPRDSLIGYHLTFFTDWLDLYQENNGALIEKFGTLEAARAIYGGLGRDFLMDFYRQDLDRAKALRPKYIVFHVSDVSIEEGFTYRWRHSSQEVIDASVEIVNQLLGAEDASFEFLLENLWWPGFTMTAPALTRRMLDGVKYPKKGIMLDTGHLMNANLSLSSEQDAATYIHKMLDQHGPLCRYIRGLHLHQSLSGAYVREHVGAVPDELPKDCFAQFAFNYGHVLQIDQHRPWTAPEVRSIIDRLNPAYLTHELSAGSAQARRRAIQTQRKALGFA